MYAYTAASYRAIRDAADAQPDETVSETVPQALLDAIATAELQRSTTATTIRTQAEQAMESLRAYRDLASPTNAQTVAVVKLHCRVLLVLIRLVLGRLDGAD